MGIRKIRTEGDEILRKISKPVTEMTLRTKALIRDMFDTMYKADGVGLAAPQVGILKRIFVIDCTADRSLPRVFINPEILETEGEQTGSEGCLSYPGMSGIVTRPNYVRVKALDRDFNEIEVEGTELLARALMHETDHLDGHLYTEIMIGDAFDASDAEATKAAYEAAGLEYEEPKEA